MAADEGKTRVIILTDTYRISGQIELVLGARVTDYILGAKQFIAVTDAGVSDLQGTKHFTAPFLNVNRDRVHIILPE
jgi:hypothetical protein